MPECAKNLVVLNATDDIETITAQVDFVFSAVDMKDVYKRQQLAPPVLLVLLARLAPPVLLVLLAQLAPPVLPALLARLVPLVLPALLARLAPLVLLALLAQLVPPVLPALLVPLGLLVPKALREQLRPVPYFLHILPPVSLFPPVLPCCLTETESPPEMRSPIRLEAGALPSISLACIRPIFMVYCQPAPIPNSRSISSHLCSRMALLFRAHLFLITSRTARRAYPSRFPFRSPFPKFPPPCRSFLRARTIPPARLHSI